MIKKILLGLNEGNLSEVSIKRAINIAKIYDSEIVATTIEKDIQETPFFPSTGNLLIASNLTEKLYLENKSKNYSILESFRAFCQENNIKNSTLYRKSISLDTFLNESRFYDLILLNFKNTINITHENSSIISLISKGAKPILLTAPKFREIKKAAIFLSNSIESANAMKRFIQLKPFYIEEYHLVSFDSNQESESTIKKAIDYLKPHGITPNIHMTKKNHLSIITEISNEISADVIVMGSGLRSTLIKMIAGDLLKNTINQSNLPIFIS